MKRRLMSRKGTKNRSGARSAARIVSGTANMGAKNTGFFEGGPLNVSSNYQINGLVDKQRNLVSASNHNRTASLNDSNLKHGEGNENNQ